MSERKLKGPRREWEPEKVCMVDPTHPTYKFKNGTEHWLRYENGWLCSRCHSKIIRNPKRSKKLIKKHNDIGQTKRLRYGSKKKMVSFVLRKGICSLCNRKKWRDFHYNKRQEI